MKKLFIFLTLSLIFVSCGMYKTADINSLTTGMSKMDVEYVMGPPTRVLAVNRTQYGLQEVLEYITRRDEVYALEFWDDYLTGYEFMYDNWVPAPAPPAIRPPIGGPIRPPHYTPDPGRPPQGGGGRPGGTGRPTEDHPGYTSGGSGTGSGRPGSGTGSGRPGSSEGTSRPGTGTSGGRTSSDNPGRTSTGTTSNTSGGRTSTGTTNNTSGGRTSSSENNSGGGRVSSGSNSNTNTSSGRTSSGSSSSGNNESSGSGRR